MNSGSGHLTSVRHLEEVRVVLLGLHPQTLLRAFIRGLGEPWRG